MKDFNFLIENPELAKSIKLEITGNDLLSLASTIVSSVKSTLSIGIRNSESYLTIEEVSEKVRRDKSTLSRWHNKGVLKHNSLGLYKLSEVEKLLNK